MNLKAFKSYLALALLLLPLLFADSGQAAGALQCQMLLFPKEAAANKYQEIAEDLGLTYLKAPLPAGFRREIIGARTYFKKDGSEGKTLYYYRYFRPDGSVVKPRTQADEFKEVTARFRSFQLDPTWKDVWLSPDEDTHIQVLAKDANNKTVALYHEDWGAGASQAKFRRVQRFGKEVAGLRDLFHQTLANTELGAHDRLKVEATAYLLLMSGRIRVGNSKYAQTNGTTGVTTLTRDQVSVDDPQKIHFIYIGKSGNKNPEKPVYTSLAITDPVLVKSVQALLDEPTEEPELLTYKIANGGGHALNAAGLNRHLRNLILKLHDGELKSANYSVKDFRTWAASVKTVQELIRAGPPPTAYTAKDKVFRAAAKRVSHMLNNTPGVARKDYIDPRILNPEAYDHLWKLYQEKYSDLPAPTTADPNFDPAFEPLTTEFLTLFGA